MGMMRGRLLQLARALTAWALLAWPLPLSAQAGPESLATHVPRLNAQRNGLLQQIIYCLERDRLGRVWAGTRVGPYVYDGRRWTPVALPDMATSRQVRAILEDDTGAFWFATQEGGIWHLRGGTWRHFGVEDGLPANRVHSLVAWPRPDGRTAFLAGTTEGVAEWDGKRWAPSPANPTLPHPWVWKLRKLQRQGHPPELWAATQKGLARWRNGTWETPLPASPSLEVNDVVVEPDTGTLWASLWNYGVASWNGTTWSRPGADQIPGGTRPTCLALTRDARNGIAVWAGTYDRGLSIYRNGRWSEIQVEQGMGNAGVLSLLEDPGGGRPFLWVGTRGGGVTTLGLTGAARMVTQAEGLPAPEVRAFAEAPGFEGRSVLWFGTQNGVAHFDGKAWQQVSAGLPSPDVFSLARGPRGELWAGTVRGVARLPQGGRRFERVPGLDAKVFAFGVDQDQVWAGTATGLRRWTGSTWESFPQGPGSAPVYCIAFTTDGSGRRSVWAGTGRFGLWQLCEGRWQRHDPNPNFPNSDMSCLLVAPAPGGGEALWVGIQGNGVARLDVDRPERGWRRFSTRNAIPLPENIVRAIARDPSGDIYLAQSVGLCRFRLDPSGDDLAEVEYLGIPEGLPSLPAHFCASITDSTGNVWFGFPQEAAVLDVRAFQLPPAPPPPVISATLLHGVPFDLPPGARLSHRETRLVFEFFVPAFFREDELQFRSQLLGLEEQPGPWGVENRREFQDLGPGDYVLKVWARDGRGRLSLPLELPFSVRPAPWRHPAALAVYLVLLILAVRGFVRLRTRLLEDRNRQLEAAVTSATADLRAANMQLSKLNEEKNRFLAIAAHDLKNPLNGIILAMEMLEDEEDTADMHRTHRKVRQTAVHMVGLIGRLLNLSALESGVRQYHFETVDLEALLVRVEEAFRHQATVKGQAVVLDIQVPGLRAWTDEATLAEVVENLVSNALKFMPKGPPERRVTLRLVEIDHHPRIEVQDEGPGFTAEDKERAFGSFTKLSAQPTAGEASSGLGLSIVKHFMSAMGGEVSLVSDPGKGAIFRLDLPLPPA